MNSTAEQGFAELAREATACRACFERLAVDAPLIDIAQPRWVGAGYWSAPRRVAFLLLNPGSGDGYADDANRRFRQILAAFRDGADDISAVMAHQRADFPNWGRGRMKSFYLEGLGLSLGEVAFANVAWCATRGNKYPSDMLSTCFSRFTERLIAILQPHVLLLSGSDTHKFRRQIETQAPSCRVLPVLHYAHRKGRSAENDELLRIRQFLEEMPQSDD